MSSQISAAVTYNSPCARSLLNILLHSFRVKHTRLSPPNHILLFAFAPSSTTSPEALSDITSTLTQFFPEHVGCISAPLPYQHLDPSICNGPHSCSLAYAFVKGVSFRSTIAGRPQAQVGRWHAARQRRTANANEAVRINIKDSQTQIIDDCSDSDGTINWDDVWDRTTNSTTSLSLSSHGNSPVSVALPDGLRTLEPSVIDNILYFSDKEPEGLATVLESVFPQATKLSLIASSTPFITGRPVTLFYNGSILSNGAVGIALRSSDFSSAPSVELAFPPLLALTTNINVASSEGNLILSLESGSPTQVLLSAIQKHDLSSPHTTTVGKEDEFYVGVIDPSSQQLSQLHRINAGDPTRGALALDAVSAPRGGSIVRLYRLPKGAVDGAPRYLPDTVYSNSISLFVAPEMTPTASFGNELANDAVVPNAFLAASENGFTLSRGTQGPWKCVVPGGRTGLSWSRLMLE